MSPREFFDLVCRMREAQKRFFGDRRGTDARITAYSDCKFLEGLVDMEILRVKGILSENERKKLEEMETPL